MLTGAAMVLLSIFGGLWLLFTYGLADPSPSWLMWALIASEVGGIGLVVIGVAKTVIDTLRE